MVEHEMCVYKKTRLFNESFEGFTIRYGDGHDKEIGRCFVRHRGTRVAEIHSVNVREDMRGIGHGSKMMVEVVQLLAKLGYKHAWLYTSWLNMPAVNAYRRAGFVPGNDGSYCSTVMMELEV